MRPRTSSPPSPRRRFVEASRTPSVDASASTTSSSVRMLASSTTTTRGFAARVATSCASLVLPSPPAPSTVTSRWRCRSRSIAATSSSRPSRAFDPARTPMRVVDPRGASPSSRRSSAFSSTSSADGETPSSSASRSRNAPYSAIASTRWPDAASARNRAATRRSSAGAAATSTARSSAEPAWSPAAARGVGATLEQAQAQRRGALREGLGDGSVGQVEGGLTPPGSSASSSRATTAVGSSPGDAGSAPSADAAPRSSFLGGDAQRVPAGMRDDEPVGGDAAEPAHERLQRRLRVPGRRLTPELVDDRVDADGAAHVARGDGERCEEGLGERAGRLDERAVRSSMTIGPSTPTRGRRDRSACTRTSLPAAAWPVRRSAAGSRAPSAARISNMG